MKISNLKATNMTLTPAITDYLDKRLSALDKFIDNPDSVALDVEVGKTTNHHKSGEIFRAELNFHSGKAHMRAVAEKEDLYAAIDEVKDELVRELTQYKSKKRDLVRRGALRVKHFIQGFYRKENE